MTWQQDILDFAKSSVMFEKEDFQSSSEDTQNDREVIERLNHVLEYLDNIQECFTKHLEPIDYATWLKTRLYGRS
ncbi:MAG: hypothetical protein K8R48_02480 [Alphaproteobacteria bacterium]|nr:hypothetical protein [Alphaproteobacteria bacterium]